MTRAQIFLFASAYTAAWDSHPGPYWTRRRAALNAGILALMGVQSCC
jgi:hypothetical protein